MSMSITHVDIVDKKSMYNLKKLIRNLKKTNKDMKAYFDSFDKK